MSKARSPRASCSMTIGTSGMGAGVYCLVVAGRTAHCSLTLPRAPFFLGAPLARGARGLRRVPRPRHAQRAVDAVRQPLQRQLAVARLAARLLRHGGHARAEARHDPALLLVAERAGGRHVEDGLHARSGHVGVLPARARRPAGADLDLAVRDLDPAGQAHAQDIIPPKIPPVTLRTWPWT